MKQIYFCYFIQFCVVAYSAHLGDVVQALPHAWALVEHAVRCLSKWAATKAWIKKILFVFSKYLAMFLLLLLRKWETLSLSFFPFDLVLEVSIQNQSATNLIYIKRGPLYTGGWFC